MMLHFSLKLVPKNLNWLLLILMFKDHICYINSDPKIITMSVGEMAIGVKSTHDLISKHCIEINTRQERLIRKQEHETKDCKFQYLITL